MNKKFLLLAFLALQTTLSAFDGFYVGVGAGVNVTDAQQNGILAGQTFVLGPLAASSTMDLKADYLDVNGEASLYAGYGMQWCGFYTGLEGFVRYSHPQFHFTSSDLGTQLLTGADPFFRLSDSTKVSVGPWHYGFDWRAGFLLDCATLLYSRLGVEWASVHFQNKGAYSGFITPQVPQSVFDLNLDLKQRKNQVHLRAGLGIEKAINSCLSLRLDYLYTHYGHYHVRGNRNASVISPTLIRVSSQKDASLDLSSHALTVGLSYYLCGLNPCCCSYSCDRFCGFYAGASIGGALFAGQLSANHSGSRELTGFGPVVLKSETSRHLVDKNIIGYAALGYGFQWNCLFLGLEGFIQYAPHLSHEKRSTNILFNLTQSWNSEIEINAWQPGINFRPGIFLNRSLLLFANLGTSYASLRQTTFQRLFDSTNIISVQFNETKRVHRAALRAGGGVEYAINNCWHLRGDYIYTDFGSLHFNESTSQTFNTIIRTTTEETKVHLRSHAATLGIFKYF